MERRALGITGLEVGRLGMGCVTFGREIDERASFAIMDRAFENGVSLFDTAEAYGAGESERILGRWLKARRCRDAILVQTKVKPPYTKTHVRNAVENSLRRLGVDCVDIYLFHEPDPTLSIEAAMEGMNIVLELGLARTAGCSNFGVQQLARCAVGGLKVVQSPYSLVAREIERGLLPYCRQHGVGMVTYSPLAAGFLSGKYTPDRASIPAGSRFDVIPGHADIYFKPGNFKVIRKLRELSNRTGVPMTALSLAWVFQNESIDCVLAGARNLDQLDTALAACGYALDPEWIKEMEQWSQPCEAN